MAGGKSGGYGACRFKVGSEREKAPRMSSYFIFRATFAVIEKQNNCTYVIDKGKCHVGILISVIFVDNPLPLVVHALPIEVVAETGDRRAP